MTKKIKISELPEFDAAEYLSSEEDVAAPPFLKRTTRHCWRLRSAILPDRVA